MQKSQDTQDTYPKMMQIAGYTCEGVTYPGGTLKIRILVYYIRIQSVLHSRIRILDAAHSQDTYDAYPKMRRRSEFVLHSRIQCVLHFRIRILDCSTRAYPPRIRSNAYPGGYVSSGFQNTCCNPGYVSSHILGDQDTRILHLRILRIRILGQDTHFFHFDYFV